MRGRAPQPHAGTSCPAALTLAQTFNSANLSLVLLRHVVVKRKKNVFFFPPSPKDMTSDFLARSQTDFRWWRHLRRPAVLAVFTAHSLICPKATNSGFLPPSFCCELAAHFCFLLQEIKNERSTLRTCRKEWTKELEALCLIAFAFQERKINVLVEHMRGPGLALFTTINATYLKVNVNRHQLGLLVQLSRCNYCTHWELTWENHTV